MLTLRSPRTGDPAPEFALEGVKGHSLSLASLRGRAVVLAFVEQWSLEGPEAADLALIRAHLRGLGAMLLVLSREAVWCFRPDDDIELAARGETTAGTIAEIASAYGVKDREPALFVIDGAGVIRFAKLRTGPAVELTAGLVSAFEAAGRALLVSRPTGPYLISRRELLVMSLVAGLVLAFVDGCGRVLPGQKAAAPGAQDGELDIVLNVNGVDRNLQIDTRVTLLDALRERLALTGSKKGCGHGQCGACTVLVDGRRINSCMTFAVMNQGKKITTIEGLAQGDTLHPLQAAFIVEDGYQCGYCTPGQIMSAVGLLSEGQARTDDEVREQMSGNICRCGAYPNIVAAIQSARKELLR